MLDVEYALFAGQVVVFMVGLGLVVFTVLSAIRTFVLPRGANDPLTRAVFVALALLFNPPSKSARPYEQRDRIMALYAPVGLLSLPIIWLALIMIGYAGMYWGLGVSPLTTDFTVSGSSLLTLGFATTGTFATTLLAFSEAALGLTMVALFISYLPTMYSAFSRREVSVSLLYARASDFKSPPSALTMLIRVHRIGSLDVLHGMWEAWEVWFNEIAETHTSLAALPFFRSPRPERSWVIAAGIVLDAASLVASCADQPRDAQAELCIRAGFMALRDLCDYFRIPYNPNPAPTAPINVTRTEFDYAYDELEAVGFPLKADRDQAWRDFAGWRVNYDTVVLSLASLTMAPPGVPWLSDRSLRIRRRFFDRRIR